MRVFPTCGITAPRLPLEKLYSLFITLSLLRRRLTNRNNTDIVAPRCPDHNHQRTERVCTQGHEPVLSLSGFIFNRDGHRGSLKTPSPSDSETPCFLRFAASFLGSKVTVIS